MKTWEAREREALIEALKESSGFQNVAGATLGFSPRQMSYKMKKYRIDWQAYRPNASDAPASPLTVGDLAEAMVNEAIRVQREKT